VSLIRSRNDLVSARLGTVERIPDVVPSSRLTLRRWEAADAPQLSAAILASLDHLRPWMPWAATEPHSLSERVGLIASWSAEWEQGGDLVVGLFMGGAVVGGSGLHRRRGPGVLEIGYWVHADYIGQGIASEAAAALTGTAFTMPDIERVEIIHDKSNTASSGVPRRLGFTYAGETPAVVTAPGEAGVDCRWFLTRERWLEHTTATDHQLLRLPAASVGTKVSDL
jgi:ribosomal-protein-serine acetyltransferase